MSSSEDAEETTPQQINDLFDSVELKKAIETEEFKHFLDHIPIGIVVSKVLIGAQRIVYANKAFEDLIGRTFAEIGGRSWAILDHFVDEDDPKLTFSQALEKRDDFLGTFRSEVPKSVLAEVYTGIIESEDGTENYRIVALIDVTARERAERDEFVRKIRDKDLLLKELQHRVKNNLQLITALIRLEARNRAQDKTSLDRLANRIESLQLLYRDLSMDDGWGNALDLGHYLSQIASAVMRTYAVDGIRLDMKVDHAPVSPNVAMPVGLLVNELLTNSFKYAFTGREGGTLTLRCLHEEPGTYRIVVADDGNGLAEGTTWPIAGKLGALVLQTLRENATTNFKIDSAPGKGMRITIDFMHQPPVRKAN
jgi:PAS domain S-box-containing protein